MMKLTLKTLKEDQNKLRSRISHVEEVTRGFGPLGIRSYPHDYEKGTFGMFSIDPINITHWAEITPPSEDQ